MQGDHVFFTVHVPGTLTANITSIFTAPFPLTLEKVSAVNSSANTPKLAIGSDFSSGSIAYMDLTNIGVSNTPVELGRTSFVGSQYPHIAAGDEVAFTLDYDASGSAGAAFTMVATFSEG